MLLKLCVMVAMMLSALQKQALPVLMISRYCRIAEDRTLITLDEHFGDWAVLPLSVHPGRV
jgi:hypothetical protein